ncbi:Spy/CpxP family protein refolding chaperone [Aquabacterium sp.]|uniref:Spy/CpxP family protein refolding chaperone n=1 Tax=Aquabacterium sp. TaxID=1872578 RepID=UPI003784F10C
MKRWIRRSLIGLLGVGVLFGGLAACGHQRYGHGGWSNMSEADAAKLRERLIDKASRELQLDEAQRVRLGQLADTLKAQRATLMAGGNPRAEVQSLVAGAQFDRAKAQALVDGKTAALRDGAPAVITAFGDFYDSLRPEQQQKLRDFMARGREGHHHGFWRG